MSREPIVPSGADFDANRDMRGEPEESSGLRKLVEIVLPFTKRRTARDVHMPPGIAESLNRSASIRPSSAVPTSSASPKPAAKKVTARGRRVRSIDVPEGLLGDGIAEPDADGRIGTWRFGASDEEMRRWIGPTQNYHDDT
ncbi:MAG: hypothetical protein M3440_08485 [Chloroflexota bacterium]|nr:hypothetical protein [Chloroflexota bacterium]